MEKGAFVIRRVGWVVAKGWVDGDCIAVAVAVISMAKKNLKKFTKIKTRNKNHNTNSIQAITMDRSITADIK
jgi:hypothetical protein